jgi:hypothetical protein
MICCFFLLFSHVRPLPGGQTNGGQIGTTEERSNHKITMLRQKLRRVPDATPASGNIVDLSEVPCEEDGTTDNDVRRELVLLQKQLQEEDERVSRLITGTGKGQGKSLAFEFAARTILATGCSARAARDQLIVTGHLFLPSSCFRYQRKGLRYEAWLYSMLRVAKCETILQWGFDEPGNK